VRSVSVDRLGRALGRVPAGIMAQLDAAPRLHLGL
jgi:mRNA-degrading endonuclease toxin of MazEF toxin-antitoxin module